MPNELYLPTPESEGCPGVARSPAHSTLRNAIQPLRHLSMGAHKLYPAYLKRQMGCVPSHGKNPGRSVHGRTATTLAGLKLRRDKLLRYAPCPLWGNVVALSFSPGEYLGAKVFENIFFPQLAFSKSPFHKHFSFDKLTLGQGYPIPRFLKHFFLENIFHKPFKRGLPTYSPTFL